MLHHTFLVASDISNGIGAAKGSLGSGSIKGLFGDVTNILIFLIGAISVIMIIVGGLRYVLSSGNPASTKGAKDTIMYAIVGLVLAASAFAIVNWVASRFGL